MGPFPLKRSEFFFPSDSDNRKEQRAGKNADFLTFSKTTAPRPISKLRLFFTEVRIKIIAAKIKRIKKELLHPAEIHLWNGTQEWIQMQICLSICGEAHCGVFD